MYPSPRVPRSWALTVRVNEPSRHSTNPTLRSAENDANRIGSLLETRFEHEVTRLRESEAKRARILSELSSRFEKGPRQGLLSTSTSGRARCASLGSRARREREQLLGLPRMWPRFPRRSRRILSPLR